MMKQSRAKKLPEHGRKKRFSRADAAIMSMLLLIGLAGVPGVAHANGRNVIDAIVSESDYEGTYELEAGWEEQAKNCAVYVWGATLTFTGDTTVITAKGAGSDGRSGAVVVRKYNDNAATVNFGAATTTISVHDDADSGTWTYGVDAGDDSSVSFTGDDVAISAYKVGYTSQTVTVRNNATMTFSNSGDVTINAGGQYGATAVVVSCSSADGTLTFANTGAVTINSVIDDGVAARANLVGLMPDGSDAACAEIVVASNVTDFTINLTGAGYDSSGSFADGYDTNYSNGTVGIDMSAGSRVTIESGTFSININSEGQNGADNYLLAFGIRAQDGAEMSVGENTATTVSITQDQEITGTSAVGVYAYSAGDSDSSVTLGGSTTINVTADEAYGLVASSGSCISATGDTLSITADGKSASVGIDALSGGAVVVEADTYISADTVIYADSGSTVSVNAGGGHGTVLYGDIAAASGSTVTVVLEGGNSLWTGSSVAADGETETAGGLSLTLADGAQWTPAIVDEEVDTRTAVASLTSDGGVISLTTGGTAAVTDIALTGDGLTVNVDGSGGNLEYSTMTGDGGLTKTGDGTLTLASDAEATTSYTGATTVEAGTLDAGSTTLASQTLTIYSGATFVGADGQTFSTLNVNAAAGGTATYEGNLSVTNGSMTFITSVSPDAPLLTVTGDADVSNSTYNIGVSGGTQLAEGTVLTLIKSNGALTTTGVTQGATIGTIQIGSTISQEITADLNVSQDGNALIAVASTPKANDGAKALSESWIAGTALLMQGSDLIAGQGMAAAMQALGDEPGFSAFATVSGATLSYNTGSHVDMNSLSLMAGVVGGTDFKLGRLAIGAFFEFGKGTYDTYNSFNGAGIHGDGDAEYYGGGLLARMDFADNQFGHAYTEASVHAGMLHNDYDNYGLRDAAGRQASFDSSTPYYGFHVGAGYIWEIAGRFNLDVYGKYFWTHQQGDDETLSTGESLEFDDVNSSRLRLGARGTVIGNDYIRGYVGAAWEYEFEGEANATTNGRDIDEPTLQGSTGIGEVGLTIRPCTSIPFDIDLNVQGYTGKREGFTGGVGLKWLF